MIHKINLLLGYLVVLMFYGCASNMNNNSSYFDTVISADEIIEYEEEYPSDTAYYLIQHLRPSFLQVRLQNSFRSNRSVKPVVYLNGIVYGDIESLREVSVSHIAEVQYLRGDEATNRLGLNHRNDAIVIKTR